MGLGWGVEMGGLVCCFLGRGMAVSDVSSDSHGVKGGASVLGLALGGGAALPWVWGAGLPRPWALQLPAVPTPT